ncbi:hypothetical protein [Haloarcula salina]|uniref:Uncharacterized protein n=1 Tax=Haloarcula salina TaxID=1429914 RepID=A0AA41KAV7_9EURY|nr:hypothetical protein [Haloarcula salina]MBV0900160.1 hypothetical protein [Haloarcula salina]
MSQTDPDPWGPSAPTDERQLRLDEFTGQCKAIAVSTSERCERDALAGVAYCTLHLDHAGEDITD